MLNQHYWTTHQEKARSLLCQGSGAVEHIGIKHKNHFHPDKHLIMKYMKDAEDDYMMTVTTICGPATVSSWSSYSILNTRKFKVKAKMTFIANWIGQSTIWPPRQQNKYPSTTNTTGIYMKMVYDKFELYQQGPKYINNDLPRAPEDREETESVMPVFCH